MLQNDIEHRQNEDNMLKCQFSARYYYNKGELYNFLCWVFVLISALFVFLPASENLVLLSLPAVADILAAIFYSLMNRCVESGALLRKYFDDYVLGFNLSSYTEQTKTAIKDLIYHAMKHGKKTYAVQISHNGKDYPPGVRDWYTFDASFSDEDVVYECQAQNCAWEIRLDKRKMLMFSILLSLLLILIIVLCSNMSKEHILNIVVCSTGLLLKIAERLYVNFKYYQLTIRIDGIASTVSRNKLMDEMCYLQEQLNTRRAMPVLGMNFLHKHSAGNLSKRYESIS